MSAALDGESLLLAGCLTAVPVRRDTQPGAPAEARENLHTGGPASIHEDRHPEGPPRVHEDPQPGGPVAAHCGSAVEVWLADLDAAPGELLDLLSPEERTRAARLQGVTRARWASSRGVLRALLGGHLERPPDALRFQLGPHGKPALPEGAPRFNVSHSGALALYALAPAAVEVGVDVEVLARRPPSRGEMALAERVLGVEAAAHLRSLHPTARHAEFLRRWVRHEATLKCLGVGLLDKLPPTSGWPASLDVDPHATSWSPASRDVDPPTTSGSPASLDLAPSTSESPASLDLAPPSTGSISVVSLAVGPLAVAALAVQMAPPEATPVGASPSGPPPSVR